MAENTYVKLKELVNKKFVFITHDKTFYQKWDDFKKKFDRSDSYQDGFEKVHQIETDRGILGLSKRQLADILEESYESGVADPIGKTFLVESNGESDWRKLRYFFTKQPDSGSVSTEEQLPSDEEVENPDLQDLPF